MAKKPETTVIPEEATTLPLEAEVTEILPETPAAEETVAAEPETPAAEETVAAEPETPAANVMVDQPADTEADPAEGDPEPEPEPLPEPTEAEIAAALKAARHDILRLGLQLLENHTSQSGRKRMLDDMVEYGAVKIDDGVLTLSGIGVAYHEDDLAKSFADWCFDARKVLMAEAA